MKNLFSLQDRVVILTGASRGIGRAMADALVDHGARVVLAARKLDALEAAAAELRARGGTVLPFAAHTGKPEQLRALVDAAVGAFGKVDVLINNAATNPYFGPMVHLEDAAYAKTLEVNLKGALDLCRLVGTHLMDRQAGGAIINVSSVLGVGGAPLQGVYGMTKAALISMTRTLAMEWGGAGIRVNAIAPGMVKTQFAAAITGNDEIAGRVLARTPLGRFGEPEDIAGAAVFLASDAARYVTGHTLVVDGGLTAGVM